MRTSTTLWSPRLFLCISAQALWSPHAPAPLPRATHAFLEEHTLIALVELYPRAVTLPSQAFLSTSPTARTLLHNFGQTRPPQGVEGSIGHGSGGDGQHCASRVRPEGDGESTRHPQRCNRQRRREERRSRVTASLGEACSSNTAVGTCTDLSKD